MQSIAGIFWGETRHMHSILRGYSNLACSCSLITPNVGIETPAASAAAAAAAANIELRKRTIEQAMDNSSGLEASNPASGLAAGQLYRVLPERETAVDRSAMLGSTRVYDTAGVTGAPRGDEVCPYLWLLNPTLALISRSSDQSIGFCSVPLGLFLPVSSLTFTAS